MKMWLFLPLFFCVQALPAWAGSVDFSFNDTSAQARLALPLSSDDYGTVQLEGRLLYNDHEETSLASAGVLFVGEPGNVPGLSLGIGGQAYGGGSDDNQDLLAFGIGGRLNFAPPVLGGFGLSGELFYAPKIFSWIDAERLFETGVRLSYAVTPKVRVYLGYQNLRTDFEDRGERTIDEEVRVGFEASF